MTKEEELNKAIVETIKNLDNDCKNYIKEAEDNINRSMQASVALGGYLLEINRKSRNEWLTNNIPELSIEKMEDYISIANTFKKRPDNAVDHRFFKLIGLVKDRKKKRTVKRSITPNWITWCNKLSKHLNNINNSNELTTCQKQAIAEQLSPINKILSK